jgi:hypothetical protein
VIIYNEKYKLGIMWDIHFYSEDKSFVYGNINFIIENELFPKKFANNFTLGTVFSNLKTCLHTKWSLAGESFEKFGDRELGDREVDFARIDYETELDYVEELEIFTIEMTELGDKFGEECDANCLQLWIGYSGDEERLFYSEDFGETFRETRFPKGTLENIISQLPSNEELRK